MNKRPFSTRNGMLLAHILFAATLPTREIHARMKFATIQILPANYELTRAEPFADIYKQLPELPLRGLRDDSYI